MARRYVSVLRLIAVLRLPVILFAVDVLPPAVLAESPEEPSESQFAEQVRRLESPDATQRLDAHRWIGQYTASEAAQMAIPALRKAVVEEPDIDTRRQAIRNLWRICHDGNRPCPIEIVKTVYDGEALVRYEAMIGAELFEQFDDGSVEVMLQGTRHQDPFFRINSLLLLMAAAPSDARALEAMEVATRDPDCEVRHIGHYTRFRATKQLEPYLTYLIQLREEWLSATREKPDADVAGEPDSETAKRNLILIGAAVQLRDWSESKAEDMAAVLLKLLDAKSPVLRRGAANLIATTAHKPKPAQPPLRLFQIGQPTEGDPSPPVELLQGLDDLAQGAASTEQPLKSTLEKSKLAVRLQRAGALEKLRNLANSDTDPSVRQAALVAGNQLSAPEHPQ